MIATSEDFTDFAYISVDKELLGSEMLTHNRQYPYQRPRTLNSDVESRDDNGHDIAGGSTIPESVVPDYSNSFGRDDGRNWRTWPMGSL